jgi:hypothetical protein
MDTSAAALSGGASSRVSDPRVNPVIGSEAAGIFALIVHTLQSWAMTGPKNGWLEPASQLHEAVRNLAKRVQRPRYLLTMTVEVLHSILMFLNCLGPPSQEVYPRSGSGRPRPRRRDVGRLVLGVLFGKIGVFPDADGRCASETRGPGPRRRGNKRRNGSALSEAW